MNVILGQNNTETANYNTAKLNVLQEILKRRNEQLEIVDNTNEYDNVCSELGLTAIKAEG